MATRIINYFDITDQGVQQLGSADIKMAIKMLVKGRYKQTIEKIYNKRSNQQNRAMWGIPYDILQRCIIEATGEYISIEDVHEKYAMPNCLPKEYIERIKNKWEEYYGIVNEKTGQIIKPAFRLTTTEMNTTESTQYYKNLQDFIMEMFGADCPDPDPMYKFK